MPYQNELVVFIHGISGHPNEMADLKYRIAHLGFSTHSVCLPQHGDSPGNLGELQWYHFIDHCQADLLKHGSHYDGVHLVGFSLGGAISMPLARKNKDKVRSLTLVAAPCRPVYNLAHAQYHLKHFFNRFLPGVRYLHESNTGYPKPYLLPHKIPRFFSQMETFFQEVQASICEIDQPTLLIHSPYDITVPYEHSEWLFENLQGDKNFITLLDGGHQIFPYRISGVVEEAVIHHLLSQQRVTQDVLSSHL